MISFDRDLEEEMARMFASPEHGDERTGARFTCRRKALNDYLQARESVPLESWKFSSRVLFCNKIVTDELQEDDEEVDRWLSYGEQEILRRAVMEQTAVSECLREAWAKRET